MIVRSVLMIATPYLVPLLTCDYLAPFFCLHVCVAVEGANDVSHTSLCIRSMSPVPQMNTSRHTCDWVVFVCVCVCVCVTQKSVISFLQSLSWMRMIDCTLRESSKQKYLILSIWGIIQAIFIHSCNATRTFAPPHQNQFDAKTASLWDRECDVASVW